MHALIIIYYHYYLSYVANKQSCFIMNSVVYSTCYDLDYTCWQNKFEACMQEELGRERAMENLGSIEFGM